MKVLCLNCCGIKTRLKYPEFHILIENYDIGFFVEITTDDLDTIELPGYTFCMKNTKKLQIDVQVIVGYKNELESFVDISDTNCRYVMWFKCSKELFKTDNPAIYWGRLNSSRVHKILI